MNAVVDEVLAGSPRYTIKDNGGTTLYDNVQIDLKTQVTTAGTPLNKALFDSIQADLNTRLLISNKATQAEAEAGSNDTKYMTPLKVEQKLTSLVSSSNSQSGSGTYTICTFANYTNAKIITVRGKTKSGSSATKYIFNGSNVGGFDDDGIYTNSSSMTLTSSTNTALQGFEFTFDLVTSSFTGRYVASDSRASSVCGRFDSITNLQIQLSGSGSSLITSIQVNG